MEPFNGFFESKYFICTPFYYCDETIYSTGGANEPKQINKNKRANKSFYSTCSNESHTNCGDSRSEHHTHAHAHILFM